MKKVEHRGPSRWLRALALGCISLLGLVAIVGSGGGGGLDSICDTYPDSCRPPPPSPPSVTVEPSSVTVQVGAPVTFVAIPANFSGAVSYQWSRSPDGGATFVNIAGATVASYSLASVNLADDGAVFRVLAWQGAGAPVQATARLAVSATPGIVFEDGDFQAAGWQATPAIVPGYPQFTHTEERIGSQGNPGAYRAMTDQVAPGSGSSRVFHRSLASGYDPRVQGAIRTIDFADDCAAFSASDVNYVESGIYIEQGERRYVADRSKRLCTSNRWTRSARFSLAEGDFRPFDGPPCNVGEACPDFSATAAIIHLGYERVASAMPGETVVHGIDNWKVTVWRR